MFTFADSLNQNLIDEFNSPGPYYTSYPSLDKWTPTIQEEDYKQALLKFMPDVENEDTGLYIHFPYCPKQCYFCICNVSISKDREKNNGFFSVFYVKLICFLSSSKNQVRNYVLLIFT